MNIVFFGTPEFAVYALKSLVEQGYSVSAVYTTPDAPVGRKRVLTPSAVKIAARELKLPIVQPESLKSDAALEQFASLQPDLAVVAAYGKIVPQKFLTIPRFGFINIHPSLLPQYRGPSPIQSAIAAGETETGVTIMKLDADVDHGPILRSRPYALRPEAYFPEVSADLAKLSAHLLIEILPDYLAGNLVPQEQDHSCATVTTMLTRDDGHIDWSRPAQEIINHIRAYNPEPSTWTLWQGKVLKISRAQVAPSSNTSPAGTVIAHNESIAITTGKNLLIPEQVQLEGKTATDVRAFINGHHSFLGSTLA